MALANGTEAFSLTEAFDGVDTEYAVISIVGDGVPQLYVETVADGQAAWQYDIFFAGPHLADIPELTIFDEGTGKSPLLALRSRWSKLLGIRLRCMGMYSTAVKGVGKKTKPPQRTYLILSVYDTYNSTN